MPKWEEERRKVWGLLLDLKRKLNEIEKDSLERKENLEQPAKRAEA